MFYLKEKLFLNPLEMVFQLVDKYDHTNINNGNYGLGWSTYNYPPIIPSQSH
jgi:hypothetical protein